MQRFIDRRTSVLMRSLSVGEEVLAGVADDGAVTVEGQFVGRLKGAVFAAAEGATALENKALRHAAQRAVGPEVARRLGRMAADGDDRFTLLPDGLILWDGQAAGRLSGGRPFSPKASLLGDLGPASARARAKARLEAFLSAEAGRKLAPLLALDLAMSEGRIKGLARGVAFRLAEAGGVLDRRAVAVDVRALSQGERRALRSLGVRFGAFTLFMPKLQSQAARALASAFAGLDMPRWRPPTDRPSRAPEVRPTPRALAAYGLQLCGDLAVPVDMLNRLDERLRAEPTQGGAVILTPEALSDLGWDEATAQTIMRGLDFAPARKFAPGQPSFWRQRRLKAPAAPGPAAGPSPFAALAALKVEPRRRRRRPRRPAAVSA
jgi:ATP-dependent RNA helicase SUPV3L1/SUV3